MANRHTTEFSGGVETVLLVSPDPELRTIAAVMLTNLGYRVSQAGDAVDALRMYDDLGAAFDLLIAEAVMSGVNGHALAQSMLRRNDGLRVLFLSDAGYERMARKVAAQKRLHFLVRPFTLPQLAAKVREALDSPAHIHAARG